MHIGPGERRAVGLVARRFLLGSRRAGPWPVPDALPYEEVQFEGNTGAQLQGRWFPAPDAKAAAVLVHPDRRYGQHWFVRDGWVPFLRDRGVDVLTFDFPGYGQSVGGSTYFHEDVVAGARWARRWAGGLPLHVVGLSLGSFAAANAAPSLDFVESLTLESPYPAFRSLPNGAVASAGLTIMEHAFPRSARAIQAGENIARACPRRILVVGSRADKVVPIEATRAFARRGPPERTEFLELDEVAHLDFFQRSDVYRRAIVRTMRIPPTATAARVRIEDAPALRPMPPGTNPRHPPHEDAREEPELLGASAGVAA
ncbi:MAG: alpha/beta hydrolase [Thermoplasmatota archaeon]